jgi:hypothetical protein
MNDLTLTQLKIIVERAVRPVRATTSRKKKMREELLSHVAAIFEEEAKVGDDSVALARTAARFGDPAELMRQLQATAPAREAPFCWIESFAGSPMQEPVWRRALRYAGLVGVFSASFLAVFFVVTGRSSEWLTLARLPSVLAPVWLGMLVFLATMLEHGMRQALFGPDGRSWTRAILMGVLTWLLVPCFTLAWSIGITGQFAASVWDTLPLFASGLLAPAALVVVVCACVSEIRYLDEWASLPIDAQTGASA